MLLQININNQLKIKSLEDLSILGMLQEVGTTKVNKSQIARELGVDRRTVDKYLQGYVKKTTRNKSSKLDEYYDIVKSLLDENCDQVFFYKRVLWQYLTDKESLVCAQSSFRRWISKHEEFQNYFNGVTNRTVNGEKKDCSSTHHMIHYETPPGKEAQLDLKEEMTFKLKDGSYQTINIFALVFSYSRFKVYMLSIRKTQVALLHFLDQAFEIAGGVPETLRTDNMKTVMDESRTTHSKGKVNKTFEQFATDYGFETKPCKVFEPQVKAKVESPMKILDELYAYNGTMDLAELNNKLKDITNRINSTVHTETGKIPILHLQKEKESLLPLPKDNIRDSYRIKTKQVKVSSMSMITYKKNKYSVPPTFIGKKLTIQALDNYLHVYSNTNLVTIHEIIEGKKNNYHEEHYIETVRLSIKADEGTIQKIAQDNLKELGEIYK